METKVAAQIANALELFTDKLGPGETAEASTVIDQLCNIADALQEIATSLENISQHLQRSLG